MSPRLGGSTRLFDWAGAYARQPDTAQLNTTLAAGGNAAPKAPRMAQISFYRR